MLLVYNSFTFFVSFPLGLLFLLRKRGRQRLKERFGFWYLEGKDLVWLHGASVGEINGILPLVPDLRTRFPDCKILITATSTTGLDKAAAVADYCRLLPFDNYFWHLLALRKCKVKLFFFGETEIWPALLEVLHSRDVKIFMVNATISDFTQSTYRFLSFFFATSLKKISYVFASNQISADRLAELGCDQNNLTVAGNAKFDRNLKISSPNLAKEEKQKYFSSPNPVIVLASIRPGEEKYWWPVLKAEQKTFNWLIVPRHPEKFSYYKNALKNEGLSYSCTSENSIPVKPGILLVDQMGLLEQLYSFADLAFVGGSMIPGIGGHNPLEASAYGVAVVMGPYHDNVQLIMQELVNSNAAKEVTNYADITAIVTELRSMPDKIHNMGEEGKKVFYNKTGASKIVFKVLDEMLCNTQL